MDRLFFALGSLSAAMAVALGAFGAHDLRPPRSQPAVTFETGVRYQMYHALALFMRPGPSTLADANCRSWRLALHCRDGALLVQPPRWACPACALAGRHHPARRRCVHRRLAVHLAHSPAAVTDDLLLGASGRCARAAGRVRQKAQRGQHARPDEGAALGCTCRCIRTSPSKSASETGTNRMSWRSIHRGAGVLGRGGRCHRGEDSLARPPATGTAALAVGYAAGFMPPSWTTP